MNSSLFFPKKILWKHVEIIFIIQVEKREYSPKGKHYSYFFFFFFHKKSFENMFKIIFTIHIEKREYSLYKKEKKLFMMLIFSQKSFENMLKSYLLLRLKKEKKKKKRENIHPKENTILDENRIGEPIWTWIVDEFVGDSKRAGCIF